MPSRLLALRLYPLGRSRLLHAAAAHSMVHTVHVHFSCRRYLGGRDLGPPPPLPAEAAAGAAAEEVKVSVSAHESKGEGQPMSAAQRRREGCVYEARGFEADRVGTSPTASATSKLRAIMKLTTSAYVHTICGSSSAVRGNQRTGGS